MSYRGYFQMTLRLFWAIYTLLHMLMMLLYFLDSKKSIQMLQIGIFFVSYIYLEKDIKKIFYLLKYDIYSSHELSQSRNAFTILMCRKNFYIFKSFSHSDYKLNIYNHKYFLLLPQQSSFGKLFKHYHYSAPFKTSLDR